MLKGKKISFRGLIDTSKADVDNLRIEFLGEFEAIPVCETALPWESGP
jgi:hypothetical protein